MTIELVTWLDAETRDAWRDTDEMVKDCTKEGIEASVVGWVIAETEDRVVLAAMKNERSCASTAVIPKAAIVSRVVLSEITSEPINAIEVPLSTTATASSNGYSLYAETHGGNQ